MATIQQNGTLTERKQKIVEEAARLFRDKGFPATSVRDLASAVGLEPSSLYSHINSKEEILRHICFNCANKFLEGLEELTEADLTPAQKLRALIDMHVSIARNDATSIIVFNDEWRHLSEPHLAEFIALRRKYEDGCLRIITDGIRNGEFRKTDPHIVLNSLLSSTLWVHRSERAHHMDHTGISQSISDLLLFGLQDSNSR